MNKKQLTTALLITGIFVSPIAFAQEVAVDTQTDVSVSTDNQERPIPTLYRQNEQEKPFFNREAPNKPALKREPSQVDPKRPLNDTRPEIKKDFKEAQIELRDERKAEYEENKNIRMKNKAEIQLMRKDGSELSKEERMERREELKEMMTENKTEQKEKRENFKEEMMQKRSELKNEFHLKMQVRFDAMVNRLDKLADRISSRLDKLTTEGKDVTVSQSLVAEARLSIDQASALSQTVVMVTGVDEETKASNKESIDQVKSLMKQAQDKLKEAVKTAK